MNWLPIGWLYIYITYHLLREPETATLLTVILGFHTRFLEPTKSLANKRRRRVYGHLCLGHQGSTFLSKEKMGVRYLVYCFTGGFTIFCSKWCLICLLFFGGKRSNSSPRCNTSFENVEPPPMDDPPLVFQKEWLQSWMRVNFFSLGTRSCRCLNEAFAGRLSIPSPKKTQPQPQQGETKPTFFGCWYSTKQMRHAPLFNYPFFGDVSCPFSDPGR